MSDDAKNMLPDTAAAAAKNEKERPVEPVTLIVGGAIAAAAFLRKKAAQAAGIVIDAAKVEIFRSTIPAAAQPYADVILKVASEQAVDPLLIVAIGDRETRWGTGAGYSPKGPAGRGDKGHGYGLMQIDDRSNSDWLASNAWDDPYTNITKGVQILKGKQRYFANKGLQGAEQLQAAIAAYNHGEGNVWSNYSSGGIDNIDYGTAGGDYSASVTGTLASLTSDFQNAVSYAEATGQVPA